MSQTAESINQPIPKSYWHSNRAVDGVGGNIGGIPCASRGVAGGIGGVNDMGEPEKTR